MTHIAFKRTGTDLDHNYEVDLKDLPPDEAQKLLRLIEHADFFNLPPELGTASQLDEQQFEITVEHEDEKHTVVVNDSSVPATLRPLVAELAALADAQPD